MPVDTFFTRNSNDSLPMTQLERAKTPWRVSWEELHDNPLTPSTCGLDGAGKLRAPKSYVRPFSDALSSEQLS